MRQQFRLFSVLAVVALLLFGSGPFAYAATFVVNSTADAVDTSPGNGVCAAASGNCTLRAAIMEANALPGADTITLPAGTYTLTIPGIGEDAAATGDLDITGDLTINGAGATATIIDGAALDRVVHVLAGTVTVSGATISGGKLVTSGALGGGIFNGGTLTLNSSTVSGNNGGGYGLGFGGAGGIFNSPGATATLNSSTVSGNSAGSYSGGGISNGGILTLKSSTVSGNFDFGTSGGIHNTGTLTLNSSTVSGNTAAFGSGGGIWSAGTLTVNSSTVSGNSAGGGSYGGGIYNSGTLTLSSSTVSDNSAAGSGGGIYNIGTASLKNTIVANSPSGGNCAGVSTSLGYNLSSDATCAFAGPTDLNNTPARLAPLTLNLPGSTETHALCTGAGAPDGSCVAASPAIDAVPLASCSVSGDQRGVSRPQGPACDIGAYELVLTACIPPPSGMVAWWPMDESAGAASLQDIIGGNNATPSASPVGAAQGPQPVPGEVGGAMQFPKFGNGFSGSRVSPQGALATIGAADFTIDAWVQVPPAPANRLHYIVNKFDSAQNKGYALYVVSPGVAGSERLEFKWGDGTNVNTVQTSSPMTTGQFHHLAVTLARNVGGFALDIRLYVDGAQLGQQTANAPVGSLVNFVFLEIGWQPGTIDEPITIDELEIFNRALLQSEIQSIVNAGSAGKCKAIPVPIGPNSFGCAPAPTAPVLSNTPASAQPLFVSNPTSTTVLVGLAFNAFLGPVDIYAALVTPLPPPFDLLLYDGTLSPGHWVIAPFPSPLPPLRANSAAAVNMTTPPNILFNGPSSSIPPGTYNFYALVVPPGTNAATWPTSPHDLWCNTKTFP